MKNIIKALIGIVVLCGLGLYVFLIKSVVVKVHSVATEIIENNERLENCEQFSLFKQASIKVGSRRWDQKDYNCKDFSVDLVKELEERGIKSSIAIAEERTHAWVLVWIEATTGEFIAPGTDLEILEIRDGELKVIIN